MIVADSTVYSYTRQLSNQFGVDFEYQGSHFLGSTNIHNTIVSKLVLNESENIFSKTKGISFSGIGLRIDSSNKYVFPILNAELNAYTVDESEFITNNGPNITLVAGYQGLNNNRVSIFGSTLMCSNHQILNTAEGNNYKSSPNYIFCEDLIEWNFGQAGILKAENITHFKVNLVSL
jgi:hypothetical protein